MRAFAGAEQLWMNLGRTVFAQLTYRESLRDIEARLRSAATITAFNNCVNLSLAPSRAEAAARLGWRFGRGVSLVVDKLEHVP